MAEYTSNYNLEKQQGNEYINIEGLNSNFDKIDSEIKKANDKVNTIAEGAEANVQSDWSVSDNTSDAFIKNKPTIPISLPANGGNADTVDGKHASDFLSVIGGNLTGKETITVATAENLSITTGSTALEVAAPGGGASFMSFHRPGAFAANFGLNKNNQFAVGGWSMGAVDYPIYHQGNIVKSPNPPSGSYPDGTIWLQYE